MKIRNIFLALLLAVAMPTVAQFQMPPLPVDKDVRIGQLDNGLSYYIRHNNWPENRANFYIAQRVGSLQEEDNQRGLAHFLEHMCFNGTDNFPSNDVVEYCRSIGVEFGRDLNAYTSVEETVYNIDNVPTYRQEALDSCLLILRDWADGLTLDPEEIDKERGVIHEEWRLRTGANSRMLERNLPALYPGSKYGERFPIGLMEVVDNFKPQELRDYYEKWYHPSYQGIIVVGNVDVDYTEAKIKELFGTMTNPENMAQIEHVDVPDNDEAIVIIDKDKEYKTSDIDILFKHETFPDSLKGTLAYPIQEYATTAVTSMLNSRYEEVALDANCPYVEAVVVDANYLLAKSMDAFSLSVQPKEPKLMAEATREALTELYRAAEYGFTPTEYSRFKEKFMSLVEKEYSNRDKHTSIQFCRDIVRHFLDNEPLMSIEDEYQLYQQIVPMIPLEAINELVKELIPLSDKNVIMINFNNEAEGAYYPTRDELLSALHSAQGADLTAFVDNVKDEPLITSLPTPGVILSELTNDTFGYTTLTLDNGVHVTLKKTDYKIDEVTLSGEGGAGSTIYPADDVNLKAFDDVIGISGLGNFSLTELEKALAGKIANADLSMDERMMRISGQSTPKDVETMLQMVYLYFTAINKDQAAYDNLMNRLEVQLKNRDLTPEIAFMDSLSATMYSHNPRVAPLVVDELPRVDYDKILEMARTATRSATGWDFTIIGNFDEGTIRQLVCQYLGALPAGDDIANSEREILIAKGVADNCFRREQETPKAYAAMVWTNTTMDYTPERALQLEMIGEVLTMEYLQKIREDASAAYTVTAIGMGQIAQDDYHLYILQAVCPMKPEKADIAIGIMNDEMAMATQAIDEEKVAKVKEAKIKNYEDNQNKNAYWARVIRMYRLHDIDIQTNGRQLIEEQTAEKLQEALREFLAPGNKVTVVMLPQEGAVSEGE